MSKKIYLRIFSQTPYNPVCLMSLVTYQTKYYEKLEVIRKFRDDFLLSKGHHRKILVDWYYKLGKLIIPKIKNSKIAKRIILNFLVKPLIFILSY